MKALLNPNYRLPSDFHKPHEVPLYETIEEASQALLIDNKMIRNSVLNSLTAFDIINYQHTCPRRDQNEIPYEMTD